MSAPSISAAAILAGELALMTDPTIPIERVHAIATVVLHGAADTLHREWTQRIPCESVSTFHHLPCTRDQHEDETHTNGPTSWVDGSAILRGKYGRHA